MPDWSRGMYKCMGKKVSPPQQSLSANSTEQPWIKSAINYVLRHLWERSLENPSLSYWFTFRYKGYYIETENILFPIAIIDGMRSNLQQGNFGRAIWQLCPENTWICQEGGHSLGWRGGLYEVSITPIYGDSQEPFLHSFTTNSLILTMYSMMGNSIS